MASIFCDSIRYCSFKYGESDSGARLRLGVIFEAFLPSGPGPLARVSPLFVCGVNPFSAPEPLSILKSSNSVPQNGFPVVKGLSFRTVLMLRYESAMDGVVSYAEPNTKGQSFLFSSKVRYIVTSSATGSSQVEIKGVPSLPTAALAFVVVVNITYK